jgi:hypothetical protein
MSQKDHVDVSEYAVSGNIFNPPTGRIIRHKTRLIIGLNEISRSKLTKNKK